MARMDPGEFALEIVRTLREAGFQALYAGGCVRDQLLGKIPKDYDVATNALPEQVLRLFPQRKKLEVGKAFGVVVIVGPRSAGSIEVATFRQDASYSDGRRPDAVRFCTPEEDALRRDFTINGLFFDPISNQVHDFVGGEADIRRRCVRAIGDPHARFHEDRLRILRAVRFATVLDFELDPQTEAAIQSDAGMVRSVSAERIGTEMRKILAAPQRAMGLVLLARTGLLKVLLPEIAGLRADNPTWERAQQILATLSPSEFPPALAALQSAFALGPPEVPEPGSLVHKLVDRWRLSNAEEKRAQWISWGLPVVRKSTAETWPDLQPYLVEEGAQDLLAVAEAFASVDRDPADHLEFARTKAALPQERLNPPALITGNDLLSLGLAAGPKFSEWLRTVRGLQLTEIITTRQQALDWIRQASEKDRQ